MRSDPPLTATAQRLRNLANAGQDGGLETTSVNGAPSLEPAVALNELEKDRSYLRPRVRSGSPIPPESLGVDRIHVHVHDLVIPNSDPSEDPLNDLPLGLWNRLLDSGGEAPDKLERRVPSRGLDNGRRF